MFEDHEYDLPAIEDQIVGLDPRTLDWSVPEAILSPYPELWAHWLAEMSPPDAADTHWVQQWFSPEYLRDVVRQYLWLTVGPGDPPMAPAVAERMATLLARRPEYAQNRAAFLSDPWARAIHRSAIQPYYDPENTAANIALHEKLDDPFSEASLRRKEFMAAFERGGEVIISEHETGRVKARWNLPPGPPSESRSSTN